jgi:hypothetical protein
MGNAGNNVTRSNVDPMSVGLLTGYYQASGSSFMTGQAKPDVERLLHRYLAIS